MRSRAENVVRLFAQKHLVSTEDNINIFKGGANHEMKCLSVLYKCVDFRRLCNNDVNGV